MRFKRLLPLAFLALSSLAATAAVSITSITDTGAARITLPASRYTDTAGAPITLDHSQPAAIAFIFLNTECPISNALAPELNRLSALAQKQHIEFYGVLSDPTVSRPAAQKYAKAFALQFPVLFDASGTLAAALEPKVTPHAFVIDPHGKLLYTGRINDAYAAVGNPKAVLTTNDLQDALTAIAAGNAPPVPATTPVGCTFESWKRPAAGSKVTWSRDLAPIVFANCASCHHEGEVAPFSLMSYQDASKRADMLANVTASKQMPPWKATDPWGTFHDERRLTPAQIALFKAWADAGAPEGDPADAPPAPVFSDKWQLGTPDLVVKMPKPFPIPAAGRDLMTFTVIPLPLAADQTVVAFEYRPGNRRVVHHMIAYLDANGAARTLAKDKGDGNTYTSFGGPGFLPTGGLGGWAPGVSPRFLPDGVGRPLKKGSDLVLNIHYHPSGKPETDQGELALYFAKTPVARRAVNIPLANRAINIPPGDANYTRTATITTPADVTLLGITPHMHNLGREMKVIATLPDGTIKQLIYVNDWDWNWQDQYQFAAPVKLPKGARVDLWARYDNSKDNPRNPQNPPQRVTFGEQTTNEMCLSFLEITVDPLRPAAAGETLLDRLRQAQQQRQGRGN